ncbi:MAG: hypothetical protein CI947_1701 [Halanaerobium sp.]|nr:MAG: hypothetical protein CI947_1701 [Halanaerobium sp.]
MQKIRNLFKHEEGFTLIELLVVIAVLGILAAIAIPRLGGVSDKAELAEVESYAGTLRSAQEMYYAEISNYSEFDTSTGLSGTVDEYIDSALPTGWTVESSGADSYTMTLTKNKNNKDYIVTVTPDGISSSNVSG